MFKRSGWLIGNVVAVLVLLLVGVSFAQFTPPTLSTAEYVAVAGAIFTALGAIWGLRKVIKLLNKS